MSFERNNGILEQNIENLKGKTLFWNIGGSYLKSIGKKNKKNT